MNGLPTITVEQSIEQDRDMFDKMVRIGFDARDTIEATSANGSLPLTTLLWLRDVQFGNINRIAETAAHNVKAQTGRGVACRVGCDFCCKQTLEVSTLEVIWAALGILAGDKDLAGRILERARNTSSLIATLDKRERYNRGIRCVAVEKRQCTIYDSRPSACRGYFSMSRVACEKEWNSRFRKGDIKGTIPILATPQPPIAGLQMGLDAAFQSLGFDVRIVEFTAGLERLLGDPSLIDRWRAREIVFDGIPHRPNYSTALRHATKAAMGIRKGLGNQQ